MTIKKLYRDYYDNQHQFVSIQIQDEEMAHDIVQDAFIKIWQKKSQFDKSKSGWFNWIARIVKNTMIDYIRANKKSKTALRIDDIDYNLTKTKCLNIDLIDFEKHFNKLRLKHRVVIKLNYLEGYTHDEISKELGLPLGTVKSSIKLGLRDLRKIYKQ